MAISSTTDFDLTAHQVITEARRKAGIHADEESISAADLVSDIRTLNLMLRSWQADGVMIWSYTEGTLTLVQSQASYSFASGGDFTTVPFDIQDDVVITRSGNDLPMTRMSRTEYRSLPDKTTEGYPTQWYYDRQQASGTLYVWPAPDSTAGTLKFTYRRKLYDIDDQSNNFDVPAEWLDAIIYNLADRLMENFGMSATPEGQKITARAVSSYQAIKEFDTGDGEGSLFVTPGGE